MPHVDVCAPPPNIDCGCCCTACTGCRGANIGCAAWTPNAGWAVCAPNIGCCGVEKRPGAGAEADGGANGLTGGARGFMEVDGADVRPAKICAEVSSAPVRRKEKRSSC